MTETRRCAVGKEKETNSGIIPKKLMEVLGPEVFSSKRGTRSYGKVYVRVVSSNRGSEDGGETTRKLSRKWIG